MIFMAALLRVEFFAGIVDDKRYKARDANKTNENPNQKARAREREIKPLAGQRVECMQRPSRNMRIKNEGQARPGRQAYHPGGSKSFVIIILNSQTKSAFARHKKCKEGEAKSSDYSVWWKL